jgi:hypothetical protein
MYVIGFFDLQELEPLKDNYTTMKSFIHITLTLFCLIGIALPIASIDYLKLIGELAAAFQFTICLVGLIAISKTEDSPKPKKHGDYL